MTNLKPLSKEITDQIRFILEGIKAGRLAHYQETVHCGSAHCVAGWHAVFKAQENGVEYDPLQGRFRSNPGFEDAWLLAEKDWKLTEAEANILFSANATLKVQFALLEYLERGQRVGHTIDDYAYYSYVGDEDRNLVAIDGGKWARTPFLEFVQQQKDTIT